MHFGRGPDERERQKERDLVECLEAHAADVDHLYLVGDVFDGYIEYRHLIPKGFARFQGLLARWTDRGTPITYLVGNHDPWHQDYFSTELGVRMVADSIEGRYYGHRIHVAHGDAVGSTHPLYPYLRPFLRHPAPVWLYRSLLPADVGLRLARWASTRLHGTNPDPVVASALRQRAWSLLDCDGLDAVVLAHSHVPVRHEWDRGLYVNTGNWYDTRSFARLDETGLRLQRWNGSRAEGIESARL